MINNLNNNSKLKCALIFLGPFPIGNVSTLRIMSYCQALAKKGVFVKVLLLAPTEEASVNKCRHGVVNGVQYQYISHITWKNINTPKYVKFYYYVLGMFKAVKYLREDKINCLLSYHNELVSNLFFRVVTKFLSIPFIIDKTEYPKKYFNLSPFRKAFEKFKLRMFDGFITITTELKVFFQKEIGKTPEKCFLLPMTISTDRFLGLESKHITKKYIATVFGTHNRDGLSQTIFAYHKYLQLNKDNPLDLVLVGDFDKLCENFPICNNITEYINKNDLKDKIIFKGLVPINDVPEILLNSTCLLTTPLEYISGGFPTKIGEYLLSGIPVVATSAGEIKNYLTHKQNILLSLPGDLDQIAQNILFVEQNLEEARQIGEKGKKIAMKSFNADTYSDELIRFLESFI